MSSWWIFFARMLEDDADDNILSSNACGYKLDPFTLSKLVVKSELDAESGALPSPSRWATLRSKMYLLCSKKPTGTPPATRSGRRASLVDLIDADHPRSRSLVTSTSARRAATPGCPRTSMPAARRPCGGSFAATRTSLVSRPSLVPVGSIWAEPHAAADKESDPVAVEPPPYSIDESFSPPKSIEELAPGPHTALDAMRRVDEAARNGPRRGPSSVWSQPLVAGVLPSAAGEGKEQDFETGPAVAADEDTASDGQRRPTRPRKPHMTPLEAPEDGMPDFGADAAWVLAEARRPGDHYGKEVREKLRLLHRRELAGRAATLETAWRAALAELEGMQHDHQLGGRV